MIDRHRVPFKDGSGSRIRIGAVSYLNSKPLIEDLKRLCPQADLVLDVPSRLADNLARGELDVALIPSIEAFSDPDYEVVSDACVATHGPVLSVKLYSRVHPGEIQTLALDEGSRTSAALTQVMLDERFGVRPTLERLPLGKTVGDTRADAILLIGDRAMQAPQEQFHSVWDLGEEWVAWTGLPFVFAMWVTRRDCQLGDVETQLDAARDAGVEHIDAIARRGATELNLPYELTLPYLTQNLYFRLGDAEKMGLKLFHDLASRRGFACSAELGFRRAKESRRRNVLAGS